MFHDVIRYLIGLHSFDLLQEVSVTILNPISGVRLHYEIRNPQAVSMSGDDAPCIGSQSTRSLSTHTLFALLSFLTLTRS